MTEPVIVHQILREPHEILRTPCKPIVNFEREKLQILSQRLIHTMINASGLGLSANQIGLSARIFVIQKDNVTKTPIVMINPKIVNESDNHIPWRESCLSMPGVTLEIVRPSTVDVEFTDIEGETHTDFFEGQDARVIQHEIDHLNGKLIIDHSPSRQVRRAFMSDYSRWLENEAKKKAMKPGLGGSKLMKEALIKFSTDMSDILLR